MADSVADSLNEDIALSGKIIIEYIFSILPFNRLWSGLSNCSLWYCKCLSNYWSVKSMLKQTMLVSHSPVWRAVQTSTDWRWWIGSRSYISWQKKLKVKSDFMHVWQVLWNSVISRSLWIWKKKLKLYCIRL